MDTNNKFKEFETYVNLKVPRKLKDKIKTAASKNGTSIIKFLEELINAHKGRK